MPEIRIAQFNCENLLQRFDFYRYGQLTREPALELLKIENDAERMQLRKALHVSLTDDSRQMTAQAIRDTDADIVCLQEVDKREVLDDFHDYYLKRSAGVHYGWRRLIEGNDRRGIDVATMSKNRIEVKSHKDLTFDEFDLFNDELQEYGISEGDRIFRRDCLEVVTKVEGVELTIFICHFKSMSGGRDATSCLRVAESRALKRIIEDKFGDKVKESNWVIAGDLNDYVQQKGVPVAKHSLNALLDNDFSVNLVSRLPGEEQWTHYFPSENKARQLDYILVSPKIGDLNPDAKPDIIRKGQPYRVDRLIKLDGRYPRVGYDRPKASDHCPVAVTLKVE